jgi:prephenate dehydrogenase
MQRIAADLKEGTVVLDTSPIKEVVASWAEELLPEGRHYIGLTPVINPAYLHNIEWGVNAAQADLFRDGLMAIVAPRRANSDALKLAADLIRLVGASPLFADPAEIDGLMAATHTLPQLLAAALVNATMDQPGWREARKVAGRAYAEASAPIAQLGAAESLRASALLNQENVKRVLNDLIAALQAIRNGIDEGDAAALDETLSHARRGRERWWHERQVADWTSEDAPSIDIPENPGFLGRLLGMSGWTKPKNKSS